MTENFETKPPMVVKEGEFCYINDKVCQVNKVRTACGEYYMAGYPVVGEKEEELNHIIDCTETVKVPLLKRLKVTKMSDSSVTIEENGEEREIDLPNGSVGDNIRTLEEAGKRFQVDVIFVDGKDVIVNCHEV